MAIDQDVLDSIRDGSASNLKFSNDTITDKDLLSIAAAMDGNQSIDSIIFYDCKLSSASGRTLADILKTNSTIRFLRLGHNNIDQTGAKYLAEALKTNETLETLNLWANKIGPEGAIAIAEALESNTSLRELYLPLNRIGDNGAKAIAESLKTNSSIVDLMLDANFIGDAGARALAEMLSTNTSLTRISISENNFSKEAEALLTQSVLESKNKNLIQFAGIPEIEAYCDNNRLIAHELLGKIMHDAPLTEHDIQEIQERKNAILQFAVESKTHLGEYTKEFHSSDIEAKIEEIQASPSAAEQQKFQEESQSQLNKSRERIATIANRHSVSTSDMLGREFDKSLSLEEIEQLISEGKEPLPTGSNVQQARIALANHEIIPHLDYFVISALSAIENPESIDFSDYPNIERAAGTNYNFSTFKQQARSRQSAEGGLNFDYLHDESQGDHMTRLRRALGEVNGTIGQYEDMFKAIDAEVAEIQLKIGQQRGLVDERGAYLKDVRKANEFRTDRMFEYQARLNASLDTANLRSAAAGSKTLGQGAAMLAEVIFDGVPLLSGISKKVSQMVGVPNPLKAAGEAAMTQAIARTETKASREIMAYYSKKQIDEGAIEREIRTVKEGMKKLEANTEFKRLEQDKTKQKAVAEAFVNKLMLNFGQHMSENLLAVCEEHGIGKIDDFFDAFKGDPRLHEAFTNLCFGYADSNDLSVIFAEVAGMKGDEPAHAAAREYVEAVLKPNIDDLYAHASKVDLIYQANLTGLGTDLHHARHMIRDEHDVRARALFGDSFGVDSQMGALTIRGAVDVKNLFDYYMHRHGKNTLTDTKIHDGLVTDNRAPKRLSLLDDDVMAEHKELAKASRGYRQDGPDVSDMFLRICGYEYFVPQAPNDAQRGNIMANNPEAPASYQMANRVVKEFIQKLSFTHIDDYRAKVGTTDKAPSKLDNLMAQTFMDFFSEVGAIHAADPKLGAKRADLKSAAKETGTFGFAFDSYERLITKDALGHFDLFLEIYKRNLEVQLRDASKEDGKLLRDQITAVAELTQQQLSPKVVEPGSDEDRHRARLTSHTYGNTHWRGVA